MAPQVATNWRGGTQACLLNNIQMYICRASGGATQVCSFWGGRRRGSGVGCKCTWSHYCHMFFILFGKAQFIEQASLCTAAPVCGDLGGHLYNFARNDWPEQVHFYYGTWVLPDSSTWVLNQSPQPDSLTRVRNLSPQPESSTWVLNLSSQLRFYIKIDEFYPKKHDFLVLRHPQKPRAKNKQKSAQKAM